MVAVAVLPSRLIWPLMNDRLTVSVLYLQSNGHSSRDDDSFYSELGGLISLSVADGGM
jgi:hypothetical protein